MSLPSIGLAAAAKMGGQNIRETGRIVVSLQDAIHDQRDKNRPWQT